jgi:protoheme IX farnesyltransferase
MIGWLSVDGPLNLRAAGLFLTLFIWQFPHFMAIAWIYRKQYASAGFRMLPTVDRTGHWAGVQAIAGAAVLIPVSLVPVLSLQGTGALAYAVAAVILGLAQLACALAFAWQRNDVSARRLLRASLVYLPVLLGCLVALPGR